MQLRRLVLKSRDIVGLLFLDPIDPPSPLTSADFFFWILLSDTETGPGVFETALGYTQAERMADNAILFKLVAKSVGMKYGILPTFMAKPWADVSLSAGY